MQTLVLDASYQPMRMVCWKDAMLLLISEKADLVKAYDRVVRSISKTFQLPKIIRLKSFIAAAKRLTHMSYSRRNVFERDKFRCQYCDTKVSQKTATIDHVMPKARGGKNTWENTVTSCQACNNKKDCRTPEEAGMKLIKKPIKPRFSQTIGQELKDLVAEIFT